MVAVQLIGLKSHAKCYRVRGAYAILPRNYLRSETKKMLSTFWPAASKSFMPESPTTNYISCLVPS